MKAFIYTPTKELVWFSKQPTAKDAALGNFEHDVLPCRGYVTVSPDDNSPAFKANVNHLKRKEF